MPGQRLVFARNPRYFRKAADGTALPYLDRVIVEIVPDQNAELLRLEAGQLDMMTSEIAPGGLRAAEARRRRRDASSCSTSASRSTPTALVQPEAGRASRGDPRAAWLQRDELRHAISLAVDRKLFADTVFLGAGVPVYGPVTPANKKWYWPACRRRRTIRRRRSSCSRRSA